MEKTEPFIPENYILQFMSNINNIKSIYPDKLYSKYEFIQITSDKDINRLFLYYIINNDISDINKLSIKQDIYKELLLDEKNKAKIESKNILMMNLIKNNYQNIIFNNPKIDTYTDLFSLMKPSEVDNVERRYSLLEKYRKAITNNQCPHLEIVQKFRNTKSIEVRNQLYKSLKGFISDPKTYNNLHTCNRCKLSIICPHVTKLYGLIQNNSSEMEIRNKLDQYIDKNTSTQYEVFCKVCHERLYSSTYEEIANESYKILYKQLFKYLWSQTLNIFPTLNITPRVNIFDFSNIIVYNLLPIITRTDNADTKIEMNNYIQSDELSANFKGYIIIYIYSFILNMIKVSIENRSKDNIKITLEEKINIHSTSEYAKVFLKRFYNMHRSIFNQIVSEDISKVFINIYTEIAKTNIDFGMKRNNYNNIIVFNNIINNTIFNYAFNIASFSKLINNDKNIFFNSEYENLIEKVLGMKISNIVNGTSINNYSNVYQPEYDKKIIKTYAIFSSKRDLYLKDLSKIYRGRILYTYKNFIDHYIERIKKDSTDYSYSVFNKIMEYENNLYNVVSVIQITNYNLIDSVKKYKRPNYKIDRNLTSIYNERGHMHNWDTIVYNDKSEVKYNSDYQLKEYKQIVDYKDSFTGIYKSETFKLNLDIVYNNYSKNYKRKIFYNFYKTRCPEKGIHTFSDKEICTKCGLHENKKDDKYYKKYYNKFLSESMQDYYDKEPDKEITTIYKVKDEKWINNNRYIIELSKIINEPDSVLKSIGAMEGRTLKNVRLGINRPDYPSDKMSMQLYAVLSHYYITVSSYNRLIYSSIEDILFKQEIKTNLSFNDLLDMKKELPKDLFVKYNNIIDNVTNDDKIDYKNKYMCFIQMLCNFIVDVYNINSKTTHIAKYFIKKILKDEFATTLSSGKFDRSLLMSSDSIFISSEENHRNNFDIEVEDSDIYAEGDVSYEDIDLIINT